MVKHDIYQTITDRIIAGLEQAQIDIASGKSWQLPWTRTAGASEPISLHRKPYRGINYVILKMLAPLYPSQLFGTYDGWKQKGAQVNKGEKGIPVIFWKWLKIKDKETGEDKEIPFARGFTVFAAEQVSGFDVAAYLKAQAANLPNIAQRIENAETIMTGYRSATGVTMSHGGNRAFYAPAADHVQIPLVEQFASTEAYYSTLAHELGHSTGHATRLNREFGKRFGDSAYAMEELVAELTAAMVCGSIGIESELRQDHVLYIAGWLKTLREDPRAVVSAASQAQKAADLITADGEPAEVELAA